MTKKFSALISVGAELGSSVKASFGGLEGMMGKLNQGLMKVGKNQSGIKKLEASMASLASKRGDLKRATDELDRLGREMKQAGTPSKKLTADFERQKGVVDRLRVSVDRESASVNQLSGEMARAGVNTNRLTSEMARLERSAQRTKGMMTGLAMVQTAGVGSAMANVGAKARRLGTQTMLAGAGLAYFFKSQFVDTAVDFEKFRTILQTTEGSVEGANKAMDWVSDFASRTPYDLAQVTDAFVKLRAYGMDPTTGLMKTLGDTSAAMGKDVMQAVEAIADAVTGENERMKEFGIKASTKGEVTSYTYTNAAGEQVTKDVEKGNRAMIQSTLEAIMNEKYAGAMDKLSRTWGGMMSNLGDQWTRFTNTVMAAGLFDWMKGKLDGLLTQFNAMADSGELQKWADVTGRKLKAFFEWAWEAGAAVAAFTRKLADFVGGWKNLALILVGLKLAPLALALLQLGLAFGKAGFGIGKFLLNFLGLGGGLKMVGARIGAFLAAMGPVGWTIAAVAAVIGGAAYLIWRNWNTIWPKIEPSYNRVVDAFGSLGDRLAPAWETLKGWMSKIGEQFALALPGWAENVADFVDNSVKEIAALVDAITTIVDALAAFPGELEVLWDGITYWFSTTKAVILEWAEATWGAIKSWIALFVSDARAKLDELLATIKSVFSWNPLEAVKGAWSGALDWIGEKVAWVGEMGAKVGSFMGGGASAPAGNAGGASASWGDPDAMPIRGANDSASTARTINSGNTNTFNITAAPGQSEESLAAAVVRKLGGGSGGGGALYDDHLAMA